MLFKLGLALFSLLHIHQSLFIMLNTAKSILTWGMWYPTSAASICFEVWQGCGSGLRYFPFHTKKVSDFPKKFPIFQAKRMFHLSQKLPFTPTFLPNFSSFFWKRITFQYTFLSVQNTIYIVFSQTRPRPPCDTSTTPTAQNLGGRDPNPQDRHPGPMLILLLIMTSRQHDVTMTDNDTMTDNLWVRLSSNAHGLQALSKLEEDMINRTKSKWQTLICEWCCWSLSLIDPALNRLWRCRVGSSTSRQQKLIVMRHSIEFSIWMRPCHGCRPWNGTLSERSY